MNRISFWLSIVVLAGGAAQAGPVASLAELEAILTDQLILEDFEGISLHGGGSITAPSPLSAADVGWPLEPGVTYGTDDSLRFRDLQDNIVLEATGVIPNEMVITFDQPQSAVGFILRNMFQPETVTFYSDVEVLATTEVPADLYSQFIGWHDAAGITSISIVADAAVVIDDLAWGIIEPGTFPVPAPDGRDQTIPVLASRLTPVGDELQMTWDVISCPSVDYNLLYGRLADVATYVFAGSECSIGADGVFDWAPPFVDDLFFVIVGIDDSGTGESSWGTDSTGGERNGATPSGQCGVAEKNLSAVCP